MELYIVTGLSGAGKSSVLGFLEDYGFYCIDNFHPLLLPRFTQIIEDEKNDITKVALGMDIRLGKSFEMVTKTLFEEFSTKYLDYKIIFLDASDEVLIKRFKETRRVHPLGGNADLEDMIHKERKMLEVIKANSHYVIDTSYLLQRELKEYIDEIVFGSTDFDNFIVSIKSFGFKHGTPQDCDLVFDVRFIPNPFYVADLKQKTGNDVEVQEYVMQFEESKVFLEKLTDMITFLIPLYKRESKNVIVIGIGCTGGKHRSVTLANKLGENLRSEGFNCNIKHPHVQKT